MISIVGRWEVNDGTDTYKYEFFPDGTFKSNAFSGWNSISGRYTLDGNTLYVTAISGIQSISSAPENVNDRATFTVVNLGSLLELSYVGGNLVTRTILGLTRVSESSPAPTPQPTPQPAPQYQQQYQQPATPYAQPQYGTPPQAMSPYGMPSAPQPAKGLATASLVLGIISLMMALFAFFGFLGLIGLILAIVAKAKGNKSGAGTAGLVLSILGLVFGTLSLFICFPIFCEGFMEGWNEAFYW